jgi:hypothetical protein
MAQVVEERMRTERPKRRRTSRKLIATELKRLVALAEEKGGNLYPRTAMCLGAVYALSWIAGEGAAPSEQIATRMERKTR